MTLRFVVMKPYECDSTQVCCCAWSSCNRTNICPRLLSFWCWCCSLFLRFSTQLHPRNAGLWIEAASHEFFGIEVQGNTQPVGGSIESARVLLQRGLRVNATSQELWVQYFSLELHYIQKLRGRREILQIEQQGTDSVYADSKIPRIVYDNAIKQIPADVGLRMKFLDACAMFPETAALERHIQTTIERDFQNSAEAWIARARFLAKKNDDNGGGGMERTTAGFTLTSHEAENINEKDGDANNKKKVVSKYNDPVLDALAEGAEAVETPDMYLQCVRFVREYGGNNGAVEKCKGFFLDIIETARRKDKLSTDLVLELATFHDADGDTKTATETIRAFLSERGREGMDDPHDYHQLWVEQARLLFRSGDHSDAIKALQRGRESIPLHKNGHMVVLLELFGACCITTEQSEGPTAGRFEKLDDLFAEILLLSPGKPIRFDATFGVGSFAQASHRLVLLKVDGGSVDSAKATADAILRSTMSSDPASVQDDDLPVMRNFFVEALRLWRNQGASNQRKRAKTDKTHLKRIYQAAIRFFESCSPATADEFREQYQEVVRYGSR